MLTIDLNCDMGEGIGNEELIMPFISSANIACGYHAGDEVSIWNTIELAIKHNVAIGAHVSFLDKANFGRSEFELPLNEVYELVEQQLIIIKEIADHFETPANHVKPHGALYNMSARQPKLANVIAQAVLDFDHKLILYGLSGSFSISEASSLGLHTANEVFADRRYDDEGKLIPRSNADALIIDPDEAILQITDIINKKIVTSSSRKEIPVLADTICIHGDGEKASLLARNIYDHLKQANIDIKAIQV
ncbi:MAG: LamB/YcsF family protein [Chitinophagaceae bacterium]|nr:LamB/YcsF family protein [Chitinophagaceae bacterium]